MSKIKGGGSRIGLGKLSDHSAHLLPVKEKSRNQDWTERASHRDLDLMEYQPTQWQSSRAKVTHQRKPTLGRNGEVLGPLHVQSLARGCLQGHGLSFQVAMNLLFFFFFLFFIKLSCDES